MYHEIWIKRRNAMARQCFFHAVSFDAFAEILIKYYVWTCAYYSWGTTKINNNNTMKEIWKSFDNLACHSSHAKLTRPNSSTVEIKINTQFPTLCWMTMCLHGICSVCVYSAYIYPLAQCKASNMKEQTLEM